MCENASTSSTPTVAVVTLLALRNHNVRGCVNTFYTSVNWATAFFRPKYTIHESAYNKREGPRYVSFCNSKRGTLIRKFIQYSLSREISTYFRKRRDFWPLNTQIIMIFSAYLSVKKGTMPFFTLKICLKTTRICIYKGQIGVSYKRGGARLFRDSFSRTKFPLPSQIDGVLNNE